MRAFLFIWVVLLALGPVDWAWAQQLPVHNQFLVNRYSLSPAYAGHNSNTEVFLLYRKNWQGVDDAPETRWFNINGPLGKQMGLGGSIMSDDAGIFRNFSAAANYAYHLNLNRVSTLSFGAEVGFFEHHVDLSQSQSESNLIDPVVAVNQNIRKRAFNATFGILYRMKGLHVGLAVPGLLENEVENEQANNNVVLTTARHFLLHASYDLEVAENWSVTPFLLGRMTTNSSLFYEAAAQVKYRQQVWLGLTYRKDGSIGGSLGAQVLHRLALNYTFETGSGILSSASASGTHEVSLGFVIGNKANRKGSIFTDYDENAARRPYFKWLRFRKVVY